MLKDNLYTIERLNQPEDGKFEADILLDANHQIFQGHFPEQPVLPGVCLVEMVKEVLKEIKGKDFNMKEAANIKFAKLVDPNTDPQLKMVVNLVEDGERLKVNATTFLNDGSYNFKVKAEFE